MNTSVILTLLALAATVQISSAVKCYFCPPEQTGCNDPFNLNGISTIEFSCDYCYKIKSETNGVQSVSRSCSSGTKPYSNCETVTSGDTKTSSCYCDTELCNHSNTVVVSMAAMVMCVIFAKLW